MNQTPDQPTSRLVMRNVHKRFGPTHALKGVRLTVEAGQVHGLIGENGAGKSTLMKVLSGAHKPDEGEVFLDGDPYAPRSPIDARHKGVAMIYQELSLVPDLSVMENILLGVEPTAGPFMKWGRVKQIAREALGEVGLGHINPAVPIARLSVAQQQLVEIARAVALDCRVLVLDEPTSSLTQQDIRNLFKLINKLKAAGRGIVYISHFLEEIEEICDAYTVMRDGETVGHGVTGERTNDQIIAMMVGREVSDLYPRSQRTPGEAVLSLESLVGEHGPRQATLELRRGEVLGIAGLVGAGRTEMMRTVFGLDKLTDGSVSVALGTAPGSAAAGDTGGRNPAGRWARGVGMVSEDRKVEGLAVELSIADNLTLSKLEGLGPSVGPLRFVTPGRQRRACAPWIAKIPIKCASAAAPVSSLSGGNQQKVAIARLLHADVDVLLLDEPTRGIDVGSKAQIYQLIDELARGGKAVLMISSYLPELMGTCDRIAVMSRGVLGTPRAVEDWNEHELMVEATGQHLAASN